MGPSLTGIAEIVSASIRRNAEAGATGMLWADGRHFVRRAVSAVSAGRLATSAS